MENARLWGLIDMLQNTPVPPAPAPARKDIMSYEYVAPRAGIMSPSAARKLIAEDLRRQSQEKKVENAQ
jgi:hypothetical protein